MSKFCSETVKKSLKKKVEIIMKIKTKYKSVLLLSLLLLASISPLTSLGRATAKPRTSAPTFSWQEVTYDYSLARLWTDDSKIFNYSSSYSDVFQFTHRNYNFSELTMVKEIRTTYYDSNYSFYSNTTISGYIDVNMSLDVYRVDVQYGDAVDLIWMALKQGTLEMESFYEKYEKDYSLIEEYYQDIESEFIKYDLNTWEVIDSWTETYNETGILNMTVDADPITYNEYSLIDLEFSIPLILVMQVYTTEKKDKIAWAEMFWEYIIYKDRDNDAIYSAGETSNPSSSGFSLYSSDEFCGVVRPMAWELELYRETVDHLDPESTSNLTMHRILPFDKTVSEIASTIQFTPPALIGDNVVSWDVEYSQFPIFTLLTDDDIPFSEWYSTEANATYDLMSPGDFNYQFDYNLSENRADLDFTLGLSKISNESLYNALQGYGLCLPHHNFFVASFDINEVDPIELTMPSDLFTFESNGTTVAEINMINPVKKNYTLYDFPELGTNTEMESAGGSLHRLLMADSEQNSNAGDPFINLIYTIKEVAEADPTFTIVDDLYHLETQNYPIWNGEKLVHDPTLTIYYEPQEFGEESPEPGAIPGFDLYAIFAVASVAISIQIIKRRKEKKTPLNPFFLFIYV